MLSAEKGNKVDLKLFQLLLRFKNPEFRI
jgi:hypothetical protein